MNDNKQRSTSLARYLVIMVVLVVSTGTIVFKTYTNKQQYTNEIVFEPCQSCEDVEPFNYEEELASERLQHQLENKKAVHERRERERIAQVELDRKKRLEKERFARLEEKKKQQVKNQVVSRGSGHRGVNEDIGTFNVSWYGADCKGCSGQTSTGIWVDKSIYYNGYGVAASDWSVIPPFSIIEVEGYGQYIVLDKGGAIKGKKLDLLTTSEAKSMEHGRQHLKVKVLRWGKKE